MKQPGMNAEDADIIDAIRRTMTGGASLEELMPDLLAGVKRMIHCNRIDVGLMDEKGSASRSGTWRPITNRWLSQGATRPMCPKPSPEQISTEGHVIIDDLEKRADYAEEVVLLDLLDSEGIRSVAAVPVIAGEAVGFIACSSRTAGAFDGRAVAILRELAKMLRYQVEKEYPS